MQVKNQLKLIQEKVARTKAEDRAFSNKVTEHLKSSLGSAGWRFKKAVSSLSDTDIELMAESLISNNPDDFKIYCRNKLNFNDKKAGAMLAEVMSKAGAQPTQARIKEIMHIMDKDLPNPPNPRDLIELRELGNGQQVAKDLLARFGEDWCVSAMKVLSADEDPSDFLRQSEKLQTALLKEVMKTKFDSLSVTVLLTDLEGFLQGIKLDDKNIDMFTNLGDVHDSKSYAALPEKGISHEQRVGMAIIFNMVQAPIQSTLKESSPRESAMIGKIFKQFQVEELTGQESAFLDAAARLGQQYYERLEQNPRLDMETLLDRAPEQTSTSKIRGTHRLFLESTGESGKRKVNQAPPTQPAKSSVNPIAGISQDQRSQMKIEAKISHFEDLVKTMQNQEGGDYPLLTKLAEGFTNQIRVLVQEMDSFDNLNQAAMLYERVDTLCQSALDLGGASEEQKQSLEGIKLEVQAKMPEQSAEPDQTSDIDLDNQSGSLKM